MEYGGGGGGGSSGGGGGPSSRRRGSKDRRFHVCIARGPNGKGFPRTRTIMWDTSCGRRGGAPGSSSAPAVPHGAALPPGQKTPADFLNAPPSPVLAPLPAEPEMYEDPETGEMFMVGALQQSAWGGGGGAGATGGAKNENEDASNSVKALLGMLGGGGGLGGLGGFGGADFAPSAASRSDVASSSSASIRPPLHRASPSRAGQQYEASRNAGASIMAMLLNETPDGGGDTSAAPGLDPGGGGGSGIGSGLSDLLARTGHIGEPARSDLGRTTPPLPRQRQPSPAGRSRGNGGGWEELGRRRMSSGSEGPTSRESSERGSDSDREEPWAPKQPLSQRGQNYGGKPKIKGKRKPAPALVQPPDNLLAGGGASIMAMLNGGGGGGLGGLGGGMYGAKPIGGWPGESVSSAPAPVPMGLGGGGGDASTMLKNMLNIG